MQVPSDEEDDEGGFQLVHGAAGSTADLPASVRAVLHALQLNQQQLDAQAAEANQQRQRLQAAEAEVKQALATQRRYVPKLAANHDLHFALSDAHCICLL